MLLRSQLSNCQSTSRVKDSENYFRFIDIYNTGKSISFCKPSLNSCTKPMIYCISLSIVYQRGYIIYFTLGKVLWCIMWLSEKCMGNTYTNKEITCFFVCFFSSSKECRRNISITSILSLLCFIYRTHKGIVSIIICKNT